MSYAAIATPNTFGTKPLPGLRGCPACLHRHALGQYSPTDLVAAGVDPNVASALIAMEGAGAISAAQLEAIIQNPDSQDAAQALYEQIAAGQSAQNAPVGTTTSSAGVPVGTVLQYTASFAQGFFQSVAGALQSIQPWLSANYPELTIVGTTGSTSLLTASTMVLLVQVARTGFPSAGDVKSILDAAVQDTTGGLVNSSIAIYSAVTPSVTNPYQSPSAQQPIVSPAAETLSQWASNNWPLLAGGVLGIVVLGAVLKKL